MDNTYTLQDASAENIHDGMSVALGCALESLIPFATGYEIIRQMNLNFPIASLKFRVLRSCSDGSPGYVSRTRSRYMRA